LPHSPEMENINPQGWSPPKLLLSVRSHHDCGATASLQVPRVLGNALRVRSPQLLFQHQVLQEKENQGLTIKSQTPTSRKAPAPADQPAEPSHLARRCTSLAFRAARIAARYASRCLHSRPQAKLGTRPKQLLFAIIIPPRARKKRALPSSDPVLG